MLGLSLFAGFSCRDSWIKVRKNQAGIAAEDLAAKHLRRSGVHAVAFGAVLSHGDCDAIAVGPQLVVVEVKHGHGRVRLENGTLRDDRRALRKDPLAQATGQAAALRKLSGVRVDAVVCVTGMTNPPFQAKNTTVCSAKDLPAVVKALPVRLSPEQAAQVVQKLSQAS
jgi:Holliday junction resolvase-like predicted endonuclease